MYFKQSIYGLYKVHVHVGLGILVSLFNIGIKSRDSKNEPIHYMN